MTVAGVLAAVLLLFILLYLWLIMPGFRKRKEDALFSGFLYAHRGLHDNKTDAPENSLAAFGLAADKGYGIELDIQLTSDKIPVVFHDFTLDRVCGVKGKVSDYTYQQLQEFSLCGSEQKIPLFSEVLKLVDGRVPIIVEFKVERTDLTLCPVADKLLRAYKGPFCMESFNPLAVRWYRKNHPQVMRGQLSDGFHATQYRGPLYFLLENLLFNFLTKPDFIAYNHECAGNLSRRLCREFYRNTAVAWTIRSEEELEKARKYFDLFIFENFLPDNGKEK